MLVQSFCTGAGVAICVFFFIFFYPISQKEDMIIWHLIADAFEILKEVWPPEARSLSLSSYTLEGFYSDGPTPPSGQFWHCRLSSHTSDSANRFSLQLFFFFPSFNKTTLSSPSAATRSSSSSVLFFPFFCHFYVYLSVQRQQQ